MCGAVWKDIDIEPDQYVQYKQRLKLIEASCLCLELKYLARAGFTERLKVSRVTLPQSWGELGSELGRPWLRAGVTLPQGMQG